MPATKVGRLRSVADRGVPDQQETTLPDKKPDRFQFRSRFAHYRLSLMRRKTMRGPDGEVIEDAPRSEKDNPLDQVLFENHYYETNDPEIAALIRKKSKFGLPADGGDFWALEDERAAHDAALEAELRQRLQERPDIARRVLKPSDAEKLSVPQAK